MQNFIKRFITVPLDGYQSGGELIDALKILLRGSIAPYIRYIKLNDAVHGETGGPLLLEWVRDILNKYGGKEIGIFLDLKIGDVSATVLNTLKKYKRTKIDVLTVSEICTAKTFIELRRLLPHTELALISALTDMPEDECWDRHAQSPETKIANDIANINRVYTKVLAKMKPEEVKGLPLVPFDWVVCSPRELKYLKELFPNLKFIVPGIRDHWMVDDHQQRKGGVRDTLLAGGSRITMVIGAQLLKGNLKKNISVKKSQKLTIAEIKAAIEMPSAPGIHLVTHGFEGKDPLDVLKECDAYYEGPKDAGGNFLGPLVAYAGTYDDKGVPKNWVGNIYFNYAKVEEDPKALGYFAALICKNLKAKEISFDPLKTRVVGAPMGGLFLTHAVGSQLGVHTIFAEKQVIALANPEAGKKEESKQVIERHEILPGDSIIICEDVCNNFSTTEKLKKEIEAKGGILIAIVCAVNRSGLKEFKLEGMKDGIPVISALDIPTEQFRQDDAPVRSFMEAGNIVWKPKLKWQELLDVMRKAQSS